MLLPGLPPLTFDLISKPWILGMIYPRCFNDENGSGRHHTRVGPTFFDHPTLCSSRRQGPRNLYDTVS